MRKGKYDDKKQLGKQDFRFHRDYLKRAGRLGGDCSPAGRDFRSGRCDSTRDTVLGRRALSNPYILATALSLGMGAGRKY